MAKSRPNPLTAYFEANNGRVIHKWMHYFDIYHRHFERFRGTSPTVLEFGVYRGGSLQMWKWYFGRRATIVGVDIDPDCKQYEEDSIRVEIGDQEDREFLRSLADRFGPFDVVIDDGGHTMAQQLATFDEIYPRTRGTFLVEDLHTSYWAEFDGGYRKGGTFIERAKELVDQLNAWHSRDAGSFQVDAFTRSTGGIHFYDSVIVFEKEDRDEPFHRMTGDGK